METAARLKVKTRLVVAHFIHLSLANFTGFISENATVLHHPALAIEASSKTEHITKGLPLSLDPRSAELKL